MKIKNVVNIASLLGTIFGVTSCGCSIRSFNFNSEHDRVYNSYGEDLHTYFDENGNGVFEEHSYSDWKVNGGESTRTCVKCNYTQRSGCEHKNTKLVQLTDELCNVVCSECGAYLRQEKRHNHNFVPGAYVYNEDGYTHYQYSSCACGDFSLKTSNHRFRVDGDRCHCDDCGYDIEIKYMNPDDHKYGTSIYIGAGVERECKQCTSVVLDIDANEFSYCSGNSMRDQYMELESAAGYVTYKVSISGDYTGDLYMTCSFENKNYDTSKIGFYVESSGSKVLI